LEGELPYLGLVSSIVSNYRYNITKTIERYKYFSSIAETYKKIYGTGLVRYEFTLTLPTAVNPTSFALSLTTSAAARRSDNASPALVAAIAGILAAFSTAYLKLRR